MAIAASGALYACGGSSTSGQDELDQARKQGAAHARQQLKIKHIQQELNRLKRRRNSGSGAPHAYVPSGGPTSCGGDLSVGPNTTCGFAANVQIDYYSEIGTGSGTVYSYSPTTERAYTMYCTAGTPHECTGGNNASVFFP